ncbi:DUF4065 domain-containing protein [Candidatus Parcubacteria bacterium]|nr:DUF4065 domain-containing protein [Candidatus Parcubacteria bacterium]
MSPKLKATIKYFVILNKKSDNKNLTNKKLQKLLYYSQAWSLVLRDKQLFKEDFQAWVHGPAIPEVYKEYKNFGSSVIDVDIAEDDTDLKKLTLDDKKLLDEIWKIYGKYDVSYLELLTHSERPWQKARNGCMPYDASMVIIEKSEMKEYYEQKKKKK